MSIQIEKTPTAATKPRLLRWTVILTVCVLTLGGLLFGGRWLHYRCYHVVLSDAVVKGVVTRLGARVDGRVKSIKIEPGQKISKDEILLTMEDNALVAAVDCAQAEYQSATMELETERQGVQQARKRLTVEIERVKGTQKQAGGGAEAARGNLASLDKQYARISSLLKSGAAATAELDRATGQRDQAQGLLNAAAGAMDAANSSYDRAVADLEAVEVRESHLAVLQAQVAVAKARLSLAEANLEATVLRAPGDGLVLERLVELGGSAKVGQPVLSLWLGRAWVEAWADERDLSKFEVGNPADIVLPRIQGVKFLGRIEAIGIESDKQLQPLPVPATLHSLLPSPPAMVPVRVGFVGDDYRLQLGLSAVVGIVRRQHSTAAERSQAELASPYKAAGRGRVEEQSKLLGENQ